MNVVTALASAKLDELGEPAGSDYRSHALSTIARFVAAKLRENLAAQVEASMAARH